MRFEAVIQAEETPASKAHGPSDPSSESTSGDTQTARSKLAAMGFEEEPDDGLPGIAIIGGVRKPKP